MCGVGPGANASEEVVGAGEDVLDAGAAQSESAAPPTRRCAPETRRTPATSRCAPCRAARRRRPTPAARRSRAPSASAARSGRPRTPRQPRRRSARDAVRAVVRLHLEGQSAERERHARADVVAERDRAEQPRAVDRRTVRPRQAPPGRPSSRDASATARANRRSRPSARACRWPSRLRSARRRGRRRRPSRSSRRHARARKGERDPARRQRGAGNHGRERVEDVMLGVLDDVGRQIARAAARPCSRLSLSMTPVASLAAAGADARRAGHGRGGHDAAGGLQQRPPRQNRTDGLCSMSKAPPLISTSLRTTMPPFMTNLTRSSSVTSASGSPDTAIRSANFPCLDRPDAGRPAVVQRGGRHAERHLQRLNRASRPTSR